MSKSFTNIPQKTTSSKIPLFIGHYNNFGIYSKNKTKALLNKKINTDQNKLINQEIVPFIYSPSCNGSRETLSSCGRLSEDDSEEEEHQILPSSSWHTVGLAHSLLSKVQNKTRKTTKFKTFPLLQRPIFLNKHEANCKSFSGIDNTFNSSFEPFSKSFCCSCDNYKVFNSFYSSMQQMDKSTNILLKENERLKFNEHLFLKLYEPNKLHRTRHTIGFKRNQHKLIFNFNLFSYITDLKKQKEKISNSTQILLFDDQAIYWAIIFSGFSLFFRIISFFLYVLMLSWHNN